MFNNFVTYHIHQRNPLPGNDAFAYQYVLTGNGVFIRAETSFFEAHIPITTCEVRGLEKLKSHFQLKVPRLPVCLLTRILTDARQARRSDGSLNEVFYQFHHQGQRVQVKKPGQQVTGMSVLAPGSRDDDIICDLHTHGNMPAFWSATDDKDEQGCQLYAVVGKLDTVPEIRLRLGLYGYWLPLPVTAVFTSSAPFKDLYSEGEINEHI